MHIQHLPTTCAICWNLILIIFRTLDLCVYAIPAEHERKNHPFRSDRDKICSRLQQGTEVHDTKNAPPRHPCHKHAAQRFLLVCCQSNQALVWEFRNGWAMQGHGPEWHKDRQTDRPSAAARLMRHLSATPELDPAPRWLVSRSFFPLWATELWIRGKRNWKQVLEARNIL